VCIDCFYICTASIFCSEAAILAFSLPVSYSYNFDFHSCSPYYICVFYCPDMVQLQTYFKTLVEEVLAERVAVVLFQYDAITPKELKSIIVSKHATKATDNLLKALHKSSEEHVFRCLLNVLKETGKEHILSWFSFAGLYSNYNVFRYYNYVHICPASRRSLHLFAIWSIV